MFHDMDKTVYKIDHFVMLGLRESAERAGFEQKHSRIYDIPGILLAHLYRPSRYLHIDSKRHAPHVHFGICGGNRA